MWPAGHQGRKLSRLRPVTFVNDHRTIALPACHQYGEWLVECLGPVGSIGDFVDAKPAELWHGSIAWPAWACPANLTLAYLLNQVLPQRGHRLHQKFPFVAYPLHRHSVLLSSVLCTCRTCRSGRECFHLAWACPCSWPDCYSTTRSAADSEREFGILIETWIAVRRSTVAKRSSR